MAIAPYRCKKHGLQEPHVQIRTSSSSSRSCKLCRRETNARFRAQRAQCHPDRKRRTKDLCAPCWRATLDVSAQREHERTYGRAWRAKNPGRDNRNVRNSKIRRRYNLSPEQYDAMCADQKNACAICHQPQVKKVKFLGVDHDHATGAVRGLLCNPCNLLVGHVERSPERVDAARAYLARHARKAA